MVAMIDHNGNDLNNLHHEGERSVLPVFANSIFLGPQKVLFNP